MSPDVEFDTERFGPDERDTDVDPLAGRIRHEVARFAAGTGRHPVVAAPTVPPGARPRGKRRWLSTRVRVMHEPPLLPLEPTRRRRK